MIDLTSDKIRTDVDRRDYFNEDDVFFDKFHYLMFEKKTIC